MACILRIFHKLSNTFFVWPGVESFVLSENRLVESTAGFDPIANQSATIFVETEITKVILTKSKIFSWWILYFSLILYSLCPKSEPLDPLDFFPTAGKKGGLLTFINTFVHIFINDSYSVILKVLTNEKRGLLRVISFDRSPFKLFSRKFSKESVQAPSCERHKTTQRTLCKQFFIPNDAIVSGCDTLLTSWT
jgi:hypothetical protein